MSPTELLDHFLKVKKVSTDSRNIEPGTIYFALKGENFNGNDFAADALAKGASLVVIDEDKNIPSDKVYLVENSLEALQDLARNYRRRFSIPVLAITGSNGKTTSKELIRDVLSKKFKNVHATRGNYNNHIGVPLTLLSMPENCDFAIIEMGANHQGEIKALSEIAEPKFGLITNIGKAHLEGFGGEEGVFKGKKELFDFLEKNTGLAFVNQEFDNLILAAMDVPYIPFKFHSPSAQFEVISSNPELVFSYTCPEFSKEYHTHMAGAYNIHNIIAALTIGAHFGVSILDGINAVCEYEPDNNRSQLLRTSKNLVLMDAYNANPSSMSQAIANLAHQKENAFFIIGDMFELGDASAIEHEQILNMAKEFKLEGIAIGQHFSAVGAKCDMPTFPDKEKALVWLKEHPLENKTILLKGSRGMKLEDLVSAL